MGAISDQKLHYNYNYNYTNFRVRVRGEDYDPLRGIRFSKMSWWCNCLWKSCGVEKLVNSYGKELLGEEERNKKTFFLGLDLRHRYSEKKKIAHGVNITEKHFKHVNKCKHGLFVRNDIVTREMLVVV